MKITATEPTGGDYVRLWKMMVDRYPSYARYAQKTQRQIPIIILTPTSG